MFQCKDCEYFTNMKKLFTVHLKQHFENNSYQCQHKNCTYRTKRKDHLKRHKMIHLDNFPHECLDCEFKTKRMDKLKKHRERYHVPRYLKVKLLKHKCKTCGYKTGEKYRLQRHQIIHLNIYPYKCSYCKFKTKRRDKLKQHQEKNHVEEPLNIKLLKHKSKTCSFSTEKLSNLKIHKKIHLDDLLYEYPNRNLKTKRQYTLKERRSRYHAKEPVVNLDDTSKEFYTKYNGKHETIHIKKTTLEVCDSSNNAKLFQSLHPQQCEMISKETISSGVSIQVNSQGKTPSEPKTMYCNTNIFTEDPLDIEIRSAMQIGSLTENERCVKTIKASNKVEHQITDVTSNSISENELKSFILKKTEHNERQNERWTCAECNFYTNERCTFGCHQCSQLREEIYQCKTCCYRTNIKFLLLNHMNLHSRERPYKCGLQNNL